MGKILKGLFYLVLIGAIIIGGLFVKKNIPKIIRYKDKIIHLVTVIENIDKKLDTNNERPLKMEDSLSKEKIILKLNDQIVYFDCSNLYNTLDVDELNSEANIKIENLSKKQNIQIKINNNILKEKGLLKIDKIGFKDKIPVEIINKKTKDKRNYYINTLNSEFPKYYVNKTKPTKGDFYGDILKRDDESSAFIFKMNNDGKILYYKRAPRSMFDFKKLTYNNKIRYSYLEGQVGEFQTVEGSAPCNLVIMDENFNKIKEIRMKKFNDVPASYPLENHDALVIDDNHYIVSTYFGKSVSNLPKKYLGNHTDSRVIASVLQEVKDGKVVWQWDSTDHPELYDYSVEGNDYKNKGAKFADYAHFNSITIDPKDGNYICSFRNLDAVIKIERYTGKILWILGGKGDQFGLKEDEKFSRQHYARLLSNGNLTIFNNGNKDKESSIMEIKLDEKNKTIKEFKNYKINSHFSQFCGSVQKVDEKEDIFVIGWGVGDFHYNENMTEINLKTKNKLFELLFQGSKITYRIVKYK